ncbi:hypothetical protein [Ralstonia sp. ASV6]|uniref:hypothetical protein n=1 Tax=Ralstonia sp. ASV6 TaxID=2795124 RepID=UPI0018ED3BD8|nr:hypothetical protein [Ralstonia sp. ASV6]
MTTASWSSFCSRLSATMAGLEAALRTELPSADRADVLKLVAGIMVVHEAAADALPDVQGLNRVLRQHLGNGFSWFACVQFLSGARARDTFARHRLRLASLIDPVLIAFADHALPRMGQMLRCMSGAVSAGRP